MGSIRVSAHGVIVRSWAGSDGLFPIKIAELAVYFEGVSGSS
jgi:hypothetical protein